MFEIIDTKLCIIIVIISIYSTKYAIWDVFSFPKLSLMLFSMLCITIITKILPSDVTPKTISFPNSFKTAL